MDAFFSFREVISDMTGVSRLATSAHVPNFQSYPILSQLKVSHPGHVFASVR